VLVIIWVGRGDPRLAEVATPQRRLKRGTA